MALPGSYNSKVSLKYPDDTDTEEFVQEIETLFDKDEMVEEYSTSGEIIQFNYNSFLGIRYQVEITKPLSQSYSIDYEIKLNKLILICVLIVIFIAFFSSFQFGGFLWFSIVFILIFYALNIFVVDKQVQNIINSALGYNKSGDANSELITKEQQEWINDHSKCPACGETIVEYDKTCPECGLKIKENPKPKPYNLSKYENRRINYHFSEKKKGRHD